ncbi:O-antigen ligase family protein [Sulfurirhabdus autotrophica]|uniref:O-antigen ligase n=1 Tax=Sulfurirhabdus autotrophica TaxID=1706046 RepID=A0A4R3Y8C1_9PROT|nr:O-antigen ligase family protein [Sulfurirhabdus autotrophica]TCV88110.1 O-antigen ligase [Sulfurirhabdus autotrophica]
MAKNLKQMGMQSRNGIKQQNSRFSHPLWIILILVGFISALVPFDPGSVLTSPSLIKPELAEQFYRFIKSSMLWVPIGLMFGIAGLGNIPRIWVGLLVTGTFLYFGFSLDVFNMVTVQEILAVAPGLATGLWLGERSFLSERKDTLLRTQSIPATTRSSNKETYAGNIEPKATALASADNNAVNEKTMPLSKSRATTHNRDNTSVNQSALSIYFKCLMAFIILLVVSAVLFGFPRWPIALGVGLALYLSILWRYPQAWLLVIPATLPLLDLAPWTGRFFFDEFDLLILSTLALLLCRTTPEPALSFSPRMRLLFLTLCISVLISFTNGLLPLQPLDANAFSNYFSHYNSLRVAKGFVWGIVLYGMLRSSEDLSQAQRFFSIGMMIGLAGVSVAALHEYWLFSGTSALDYRVTATFSSMHIGGGHIEAYLIFALSFTWLLLWQEKRIWIKAIAIGVFLIAIYALVTTVARGGIVALAVVFVILAFGMYRNLRARGTSRTLHYTASALLVSGLIVVILGIGTATFLQQRFAQTGEDAHTRFTHWSKSLNLLQKSWIEQLFGAGLGSFPERYFYANFDSSMGNYRYKTEQDNRYLSLNSGGTLYMAQSIKIMPNSPYTLSLDVRASDQTKRLDISICEKKLFNSHLCQWLNVPVTKSKEWQHQNIVFSSGQVGQGAWWARRPVQLSLYNPQDKGVVDIDNIHLTDSNGDNLISNGDFAQGGDYWFFKSGNHLAWHIKNMWVHLIFEQGIIGLIIFCTLTLVAVWHLLRSLYAGSPHATAWLASISGLLTIGFVDSLFDAPRLGMMLVLALLVGISQSTRSKTSLT